MATLLIQAIGGGKNAALYFGLRLHESLLGRKV